MNYSELKQFTFELIDKLSSSNIESASIEFEQAKIHISKSGNCAVATSIDVGTKDIACNQKTILSPMVGTFYAAPTPDDEPFVKVGDEICKGETVCIIEAMKLMNEIEADKSGTIKEILVSNGQLVEYNQPLIVIE
ncbi:MAG: acetyl-CoA carboxylase biotin carboxyl carrier protein [Firmicutes bacterium]|nr:acetyl-CoA carboxylase biotin carboxyl carrier protein [Bacillota bacterium]